MPHSLSIVIPAYNEESAIRAGKLALVINWLKQQPFESELIVVNDQSTDATAGLATAALEGTAPSSPAEPALSARPDGVTGRVITISHAGKAAAVIAGIRAAQGEWVLFSDMDQATPVSEATKLLAALEEGCDIAAGSRGVVRKGAPLGRYIISLGQVTLKSTLLGLRITDTQCGFKAFTRSAALEIIDHLVVYAPERLGTVHGPSVTSGFDVEFLLVGQRMGYRIREVPVQWNYQRTRRVNLVRDAGRGLRDLFGILKARVGGRYPKRI